MIISVICFQYKTLFTKATHKAHASGCLKHASVNLKKHCTKLYRLQTPLAGPDPALVAGPGWGGGCTFPSASSGTARWPLEYQPDAQSALAACMPTSQLLGMRCPRWLRAVKSSFTLCHWDLHCIWVDQKNPKRFDKSFTTIKQSCLILQVRESQTTVAQ